MSVTLEQARNLTRAQRKRMRALGIDVPFLPQGGSAQGGRGKPRQRQYERNRSWETMRSFNIEHEGNRLADNAESGSDALLRLLRQHHPEQMNSHPFS